MGFTPEQRKAIDLDGTNIIVSAGAGSGKTAVLTERVKRKILDGVHVNELLVLTFTNAAAAEMKDRIRKAIIDTPSLHDELNLIDGAYITTFDSFSLSMVKKYHTRLNITNSPAITEEVVIDLKKKEILDSIFDENYSVPSKDFLCLITDFCHKNDKNIKKYILNVYRKIELKYDKTDFINNYFNIYNEEKVDSFILEYLSIIKEKQNMARNLFNEFYNYFEDSYIIKVEDQIKDFLNANTYSEFLKATESCKIQAVPRGSDDDAKKVKEALVEVIKDVKDKYLIYDSLDTAKKEIMNTYNNSHVLIDIIKELDKRLDSYKRQNNIFSFNDIARLAIKVVEENEDIREELRSSFNEIMIDEYQDTSDTQEAFISLISNNNVYMVGDIKQSIYRFRNANPSIFKDKYELYSNTSEGEKIDLLKNFRSRDEVLQDVNLLFDKVMDNVYGGADYIKSHRMVFGNMDYVEKGSTNQNNHLDVILYDKEKIGKVYLAMEEAFIICNDIKDKIKNRYQVFDKNKKELRDCRYSDFVILLDKSKDFTLYKNVFEYNQIPLTILKEEQFKKDDDAYIFRNLLKLIIHINDNNFDNEFKYAFTSLSRSYLYRISDCEIYDYFVNDNFKESELYKDLEEISREVNYLTPSLLVRKVLNKVMYDSKLLNISNIKANRIRCEYFYNLIKNYEVSGKTLYDFVDYLDNIFSDDYELKFNINSEVSDSCMIMTIHKSKGLEYPICYFAGFSSNFSFKELNDRILFDNQYGLILPYVNGYFKNTILKTLLKRRTRIEEIGERIRLLYVAVTRAREKMVIVIPKQDDDYNSCNVSDYTKSNYSSFLSIIKSIYSDLVEYSHLSDIVADRRCLEHSCKNKYISECCDKIVVTPLNIETNLISNKHFSKESLHLVTKDEKERLEFGTKLHETLELLDFSDKTSIESISNSYIKSKIKAFLNSSLMKDRLDKKMYKEYEFLYMNDNVLSHGIIDLLIDDIDKYIIIDYKLKGIDDENYDKQLNGYRNYIENKTGKEVDCYLYSLIDEKYIKVEEN